MNLTLWTSYQQATDQADEWANDTGIDYLVIERFPAGPVIDVDLHEALVPADMCRAEHRYTVLSRAEWAQVEHEWDAEVQYEARTPR